MVFVSFTFRFFFLAFEILWLPTICYMSVVYPMASKLLAIQTRRSVRNRGRRQQWAHKYVYIWLFISLAAASPSLQIFVASSEFRPRVRVNSAMPEIMAI